MFDLGCLSLLFTLVSQIEKVFTACSQQKVWDHFTKAQRRNIEAWKKQAEVSLQWETAIRHWTATHRFLVVVTHLVCENKLYFLGDGGSCSNWWSPSHCYYLTQLKGHQSRYTFLQPSCRFIADFSTFFFLFTRIDCFMKRFQKSLQFWCRKYHSSMVNETSFVKLYCQSLDPSDLLL